jgi:hypothetical protein
MDVELCSTDLAGTQQLGVIPGLQSTLTQCRQSRCQGDDFTSDRSLHPLYTTFSSASRLSSNVTARLWTHNQFVGGLHSRSQSASRSRALPEHVTQPGQDALDSRSRFGQVDQEVGGFREVDVIDIRDNEHRRFTLSGLETVTTSKPGQSTML